MSEKRRLLIAAAACSEALRRDRITASEAREAMRDLPALPFVLFDVASIAGR